MHTQENGGLGHIELPVQMRTTPALISGIFRIVTENGGSTFVSAKAGYTSPESTTVPIIFTCNVEGIEAPTNGVLDRSGYQANPSSLELSNMVIFDANL